LSAALDSADRKWQTLTSTLSTSRGILNEIAEGVGLTYQQLGLFNSAMAIAGAGASGWQAGRMIAEFFDLDKKIGNATANLLGWSDATQVAGAKQDTMALASTRAHRVILDYNEAIRVNQEFVDQAVRKRAPEEFARQMEAWRGEIEKIQAAGALPPEGGARYAHHFHQGTECVVPRLGGGRLPLPGPARRRSQGASRGRRSDQAPCRREQTLPG
jgi:hypothetical protein